MKILMVLTTHEPSGASDRHTGFWPEEFAAPYYAFKDAGAAVTLASPYTVVPSRRQARAAQLPANRAQAVHRFNADPAAQAALAGTCPLRDVTTGDFDVVFYPDSQRPHWDWPGMDAAAAPGTIPHLTPHLTPPLTPHLTQPGPAP